MSPRPFFIEGLRFRSALIYFAEESEKLFFVRLKCCYTRINSCLDASILHRARVHRTELYRP